MRSTLGLKLSVAVAAVLMAGAGWAQGNPDPGAAGPGFGDHRPPMERAMAGMVSMATGGTIHRCSQAQAHGYAAVKPWTTRCNSIASRSSICAARCKRPSSSWNHDERGPA